jgi:hypothetical protein
MFASNVVVVVVVVILIVCGIPDRVVGGLIRGGGKMRIAVAIQCKTILLPSSLSSFVFR